MILRDDAINLHRMLKGKIEIRSRVSLDNAAEERAINIEDIESPKVLEIVERLTKEVSIPVFHDDQHGTAIITLAALINALRLANKELDKVRVVILGSGSAGYGIFKILQTAGCKDIIVIDTRGAIFDGRVDIDNQNPYKKTFPLTQILGN